MTEASRLETEAAAFISQYGGIRPAAAATGISYSTLHYRASKAAKRGEFLQDDIPHEPETIEELLERRRKAFSRKSKMHNSRSLIAVKVKLDGPIGILHTGDPHLDDDGCDFTTLERHIELARSTEGLLAGNVGDATNNWIGRLARLYGQQSSTAAEGWRLAEWFVNSMPWLYLIGGNHDAWSGAGDPLKWISGQAGVPYEMHGARLALKLPNGREIRVNGRHDFNGHSMWNPAHGPSKAAQMGPEDHIYVCGHRHVFGMAWNKRSSGLWSLALRVGTYKHFDSYAAERGFRDHNIPAAVTIIFPDASEEGLIEVFKDVEQAADFLKWARARHATGKTVKAGGGR